MKKKLIGSIFREECFELTIYEIWCFVSLIYKYVLYMRVECVIVYFSVKF